MSLPPRLAPCILIDNESHYAPTRKHACATHLTNQRPRSRRVSLAATLTGCAAPRLEESSGIQVVASTSVYGDIARAIGGEAVSVTSLISDAAQDPHSYEASARDQLALSHADVVIENGGGYDDFVTTLLKGTDNADATVSARTTRSSSPTR